MTHTIPDLQGYGITASNSLTHESFISRITKTLYHKFIEKQNWSLIEGKQYNIQRFLKIF